jgi:hypothetical protein
VQLRINLFEEIGAQALSSRSYLWLDEIYAESGRKEEALENLKKSETRLREMGHVHTYHVLYTLQAIHARYILQAHGKLRPV